MSSSPLPSRFKGGLSSWLHRDPVLSLRPEMDDILSRLTEMWDDEWLPVDRAWLPNLDLSETDKTLQITMDLPGVKSDEIAVNVTGNTVHVTGEHKEEQEEKGKTFHRIERRTGAFSRTVQLPCPVKDDAVDAEYKDGVLKITLPKTEASKSRQVKVKG